MTLVFAWKLQKTDPDAVRKIMFNALNICAYLAPAFEAFLPSASNRIRKMLAIDPIFKGYLDGHEIGTAVLLFKKVEDEENALMTKPSSFFFSSSSERNERAKGFADFR